MTAFSNSFAMSSDDTKNSPPAAEKGSELHPNYTDKVRQVRDRALLYTCGMDTDPIESVDIALQSLQIARGKSPGEDNISADRVMEELGTLLKEKNIPLEAHWPDGSPLKSAPPINRRSMLAEEMELNPLRPIISFILQKVRCFFAEKNSPEQSSTKAISKKYFHRGKLFVRGEKEDWEKIGFVRRVLLLFLVLFPSLIASQIMHSLLPKTAWEPLLLIITGLFALLFCWISVGFWSSLAGFIILLHSYDRFNLCKSLEYNTPIPESVRTALIFPIYNEDAFSVSAGIAAVWQSICREKLQNFFDIFILSDSTKADAWINEEEIWRDLCLDNEARKHIFYRRRSSNLKRKSGNIADFCRRWGANYRYMIVFDADSLMSAKTLERMVRIMEANPKVGIVQSPPKAIKSRSLIARVQQFANHLYGPVFAAGMNYWQLGDAQYWGHNAIIRVEPFMRHCQLQKLPGREPLGGEILSHDFVESALMRRAGYGVWLAYDLDGSWEQLPPSLIDELVRDRRWCQGNLQHGRLIFTRGFFPTHRALFINGIMSYGSAFLWLFFLLATSVQALGELIVTPRYFPVGPSLFPDWPRYFPNWALTLLSSTAVLLFVPKLLALVLVVIKDGATAFGGIFKMSLSVLCEVLVSTFLAPVRMLFHSYFIIGVLLGKNFSWNPQRRDDRGTSWTDAIRFHWWSSILGLVWGWLIYLINPGFFLWLSPVIIGLVISIPLSVWSSRTKFGEAAHKAGLFLTPADTYPAPELKALEYNLNLPPHYSPFKIDRSQGFIRAVVVPSVFSLHKALSRTRRRHAPGVVALIDKALHNGPDKLSNAEKITLLGNPDALSSLHHQIWTAEEDKARLWGIG